MYQPVICSINLQPDDKISTSPHQPMPRNIHQFDPILCYPRDPVHLGPKQVCCPLELSSRIVLEYYLSRLSCSAAALCTAPPGNHIPNQKAQALSTPTIPEDQEAALSCTPSLPDLPHIQRLTDTEHLEFGCCSILQMKICATMPMHSNNPNAPSTAKLYLVGNTHHTLQSPIISMLHSLPNFTWSLAPALASCSNDPCAYHTPVFL